MKLIKNILVFALCCTFSKAAQASTLIINPGVRLPQDSAESRRLTTSLENFLIAAQGDNAANTLVFAPERAETYVLLDEINGMESNAREQNEHYYQPYLVNVVPLADSNYLVQVAYMAVQKEVPVLRAGFELVAHRAGASFLYSSPLLRNTRHWKTWKTADQCIFHYKDQINKKMVASYGKNIADFDRRLKSANKITELYCCADFTELQHLIGITYKFDYNGYPRNVLSTIDDNRKLVVLGMGDDRFDNYDPHDLWHERLSMVVPRAKVNKPVDEACAYLYGGSWGISWATILQQFKAKVAVNKEMDWLACKEKPLDFGPDASKHLMADYVVNALIIQKIEREKGFAGVWELLNCGPYEAGNANYYAALERLTGINKANYNDRVRVLIEANAALK